MGSRASSELRFWWIGASGLREVEGPGEWREVLVELPVPVSEWQDARVTLQDRPLEVSLRKVDGKPCPTVMWPRSDPGRYRLKLVTGRLRAEWTVPIQPEKIRQDTFETMLRELQSDLPQAVAIALQRGGALSGVDLAPAAETTLADEVARLRRAVLGGEGRPGLADLLPAIERAPHQVLTDRSLAVPAARARRPDLAELTRTARPTNLTEERRPKKIVEQRSEPTVDVYENKLVKLFVEQIRLRLARLRHAGLSGDLAEELEDLWIAMRNAERSARFLERVEFPRHFTRRLTMVLMRVPHYRATFERYLEFHRTLRLHLKSEALDAPLDNLPKIYQQWCTLHVLKTVVTVCVTLGLVVERQTLVRRDPKARAFVQILASREAIVVLRHPHSNALVRLYVEHTFGSSGHMRSISFNQRPDIVLSMEHPNRSPVLALLDPKYKLDSESGGVSEGPTGRPKKVDVDKMHAYRDAIRGPHGQRIVSFAATLYPGVTEEYSPGLAAIRAVPGDLQGMEYAIRRFLENQLIDRQELPSDL